MAYVSTIGRLHLYESVTLLYKLQKFFPEIIYTWRPDKDSSLYTFVQHPSKDAAYGSLPHIYIYFFFYLAKRLFSPSPLTDMQ